MTTWQEVHEKFMEKYFSHLRTSRLREEITHFEQSEGELFHEAWGIFKQLIFECPHHSFEQELLYQFFYQGLTLNFQSRVDTAAGGAILNKTGDELREIYEGMLTNSIIPVTKWTNLRKP